MSFRKLLATGALGLLLSALVFGAAPAKAAPTLTITSPANNDTWDATSSADFHVKGQATTDSGGVVTRVDVVADSSDAAKRHYPAQGSYNQTWSGNGQQQTVQYDVGNVLTGAANGPYKLTVTETAHNCNILGCTDPTDAKTVNIVLAVPPRPPGGVGATLKDSVVTVQWSANTETDMLGYLIERNKSNGSFGCIAALEQGTSSTYKITDDLKDQDAGVFKYRVTAVRAKDLNSASPTCKNDGGGLKSAPATASQSISWKMDTTTTTTPGGGGGGGGGGGTTTTVKPTDGLTRYSSGGAGGSTGKAGSSKKPNLAPLAGFSAVNDLAKSPSARLPGATGEPDTGFNELLPFGSQGALGQPDVGGSSQSKLATDKGGGHTTTLLFVAAGLLVTVLSMHVLWLKAQVDRVPLEALPPGDLPVA